jgi:hypothetical protein
VHRERLEAFGGHVQRLQHGAQFLAFGGGDDLGAGVQSGDQLVDGPSPTARPQQRR